MKLHRSNREDSAVTQFALKKLFVRQWAPGSPWLPLCILSSADSNGSACGTAFASLCSERLGSTACTQNFQCICETKYRTPDCRPSLQPWNPAQCHTEWHDPTQLDRSYPENLVGRRCLLLCLRAAMDRAWKPLVFNIDADLHEPKKWHGRDLNMSWHTHTQRSSTN